ncbi:uncharacterized protein LOC144006986 [Festucalex cinctus]
MKTTSARVLLLLLLLLAGACLRKAECSLPVEVDHAHKTVPGPHLGDRRSDADRLPGLCRRLRRRRLGYLCHKKNFCWWGRSRGRGPSGQTCRCPRGSTCGRVFIPSI